MSKVHQSLNKIMDYCENETKNECYVRGVNRWITEDELLHNFSEDIINTNLGVIINQAEKLVMEYKEIKELSNNDYYSFIRKVSLIDDVNDFIYNCDYGNLKNSVCATVLYYIARNEYDKIFNDYDIISQFVNITDMEKYNAIDNISCDENKCIVTYKGINADPFCCPSMSLDYPIITIFEGKYIGINQYSDGYIVKPKKLLLEFINKDR